MSNHQDRPTHWMPYVTFAVFSAIAAFGGSLMIRSGGDGPYHGSILLIFFGLAAIVVPTLQSLHHRKP